MINPDGKTPSSEDVLGAALDSEDYIDTVEGSTTVISCEKDIEYD